MCQQYQNPDVSFVTMKSISRALSNNGSNNDPYNQMVVKVCDISDENKKVAAEREAKILQKLNCEYINRFIDFYQDPLIDKAYLVLEYAGNKSLLEFVEERKIAAQVNDDHQGPIFKEE